MFLVHAFPSGKKHFAAWIHHALQRNSVDNKYPTSNIFGAINSLMGGCLFVVLLVTWMTQHPLNWQRCCWMTGYSSTFRADHAYIHNVTSMLLMVFLKTELWDVFVEPMTTILTGSTHIMFSIAA
jgi:hypothetical protein